MLQKLHRYGPFNSHDALKLLAIITMIIDHIAYYFFQDLKAFRLIGRFSFPLFLFLVGYSQKYKVTTQLAIAAASITIIQFMIGNPLSLNILFTIFITIVVLQTQLKTMLQHPWITLLITSMLALPTSLFFDYGTIAISFALIGYYSATTNKHLPLFTLLTLLAHTAIQIYTQVFNTFYGTILILEMMILYYIFTHYHIKPLHHMNNIVFKFLARYSLYIYAIHIIVFEMIAHISKVNI